MNRVLIICFLLLVSCGKPAGSVSSINLVSSNIINGDDVETGSTVEQSTVQLPGCSGTIISDNLIITAAHCVSTVKPKLFSKPEVIKYSSINVSFKNPESSIASAEITIHPQYDGGQSHDFALIKLSKKIPQETYRPVSLLSSVYQLDSNTELLIAGYGMQCQKCDSPYKVKSTLLQKRKQSFLNYQDKNLLIKQVNGAEGAFQGDSGGPAYLETQTELLLVGSTIGGLKNENALYVNLSSYKTFILDSALKMNAALPVFKMPNE